MKRFLGAAFVLGALVCGYLAFATASRTKSFDPEELIRNEEAAIFTVGFVICLILGALMWFLGRKKKAGTD